MDSCWNTIGVHGDQSCERLPRHVHCRNCPVHAEAALGLLDRAAPEDYRDDWSAHVARPVVEGERHRRSLVIFRVGAEWFGLPPVAVAEVTRVPAVHSLPHRRRDLVLGVANIRGVLTPCVSLAGVLGVSDARAGDTRQGDWRERCLVLREDSLSIACPVDEIEGIERVHEDDFKDVPLTLAKAAARHSHKVLVRGGQVIGVLDVTALFTTLQRALA